MMTDTPDAVQASWRRPASLTERAWILPDRLVIIYLLRSQYNTPPHTRVHATPPRSTILSLVTLHSSAEEEGLSRPL